MLHLLVQFEQPLVEPQQLVLTVVGGLLGLGSVGHVIVVRERPLQLGLVVIQQQLRTVIQQQPEQLVALLPVLVVLSLVGQQREFLRLE